MRPVLNRAVAVGALAAATGIAFLLALTFLKRGGFSEKDSYLVHALFSDATGLTWKSRVQIAGIQVGEVSDIVLEGARARLDLRIKKEIELHVDACLTKRFPSALLPDALLEVQPGSMDKPLLTSIPEPERQITCIREATGVQQLIDSLSKIASDVQLVSAELANAVAGDQGLRNIIENLASATRRIDETIARNEENLADIVSNTRYFTADLREISARDKDKIGRITTNVEQLTSRLKSVAASLQEIIDPESAARSGTSSTSGVAQAVAAATPSERAAASERARGVKQAVDKLSASLEKLDDIVERVNEGKSVAGRLLVDERLGRKVGNAAEELADELDRVFKLQVQLQLRSEWLLNQTGAKSYFGARLLPRPDKYYLFEIVADPRGVDSVTTETVATCVGTSPCTETTTTRKLSEDKLTFTLQIAKRYGPLTLRGGVIESSGGVGTDLHLMKDALQLSVSVYQLSRPYPGVFPRAKIWMNYYFLQHLFVTAGADDFLNKWEQQKYPFGGKFTIGNDVFFGGGIFFTDDDLKTLLGAGAGSAVRAK